MCAVHIIISHSMKKIIITHYQSANIKQGTLHVVANDSFFLLLNLSLFLYLSLFSFPSTNKKLFAIGILGIGISVYPMECNDNSLGRAHVQSYLTIIKHTSYVLEFHACTYWNIIIFTSFFSHSKTSNVSHLMPPPIFTYPSCFPLNSLSFFFFRAH